ncbi:hypothetical protein [Rhodococcus sp. SMB37]|uniref:hypothetical protein n=1 Tax=Rhodococcus sp. SMB37 TaxID=2512213 RepID=UPI0024114FE0|nr:hypothetical protein [Rhodococcus sp. SMB37]
MDILVAAAETLDRLIGMDPAEYGDPCVDIGEGWESASALALGLLAADLATVPEDQKVTPDEAWKGPQALAWAATSNGDSDSIACIAGALIGAAQSAPDYWRSGGLTPRFEPRYTDAIAAASNRLPGDGVES